MRLIRVSAPAGSGADVANTAFSVGIGQVSVSQAQSHRQSGEVKAKEVVDIETSTPKARIFLENLLRQEFYNSQDFTITIRQPRAVLSSENVKEITPPFVEPPTDIFQELWQFSHVTTSFIGRFLVAAFFLAYGIIEQQTLLIIAGLLFLPLLPLLLAISFGTLTRQWRLVAQGALAFLVAISLLVVGGAIVAAFTSPPLKYNEFNSLLVSFLISLGVAIAAVLANTDDVGRRELLGLAATAQIAIIPVWFGVNFVFGFPGVESSSQAPQRALAFAVNVATIVVASLITYAALRFKGKALDKTSN